MAFKNIIPSVQVYDPDPARPGNAPIATSGEKAPLTQPTLFGRIKMFCARHLILVIVSVFLIISVTTATAVGVTLSKKHASADDTTTSKNSGTSTSIPTNPANTTADATTLKTWWHASGELNTKTPVAVNNVRQSHAYTVQIGTVSNVSTTGYYDSFVYESIPRNGNGQICYPGQATICTEVDGITIEPSINVTMAWTQFLYSEAVYVKIARRDGLAVSADDVVIRPTTLDYDIATSSDAIVITLPYSVIGTRFSVEFANDLWTYHTYDGYYVQDETSSGVAYVEEFTDAMPIVGVEPRNALLIFASPFPASSNIPSTSSSNTYYPSQGLVTAKALNSTTATTVWFQPGVYYLTGTAHALLSSTVTWLYLAPGAYLKGAVEFSTSSLDQRATGFGVVSGEQYVYQANTASGYSNNKSNTDSLKMWSGLAPTNGTWTLHGITLACPPFNTMDFYGDVEHFSIQAHDYKQVGAFFWQTDGLEMYPGSEVKDVFYHTGDDTLKTYYSNVHAARIINWKTNNGAVIQMGWTPRNLSNVYLHLIDVIHSRYYFPTNTGSLALIGAAPAYTDVEASDTAETNSQITGYTITGLRSEGVSPALFHMVLLQNVDNFTVNGVWVESYSPLSTGVGYSLLTAFTNSAGEAVVLGGDSPSGIGLNVLGYMVGSTNVTLMKNNWESTAVGLLNFPASLWGKWSLA